MTTTKIRQILKKIFDWDRTTLALFLAFFFSFIGFDIIWCMSGTFKPFSHLPLYVGAIGFSLLFTLPWVLWRRRLPVYLLLVLLQIFFVANLMYSRTYMEAIPLHSILSPQTWPTSCLPYGLPCVCPT